MDYNTRSSKATSEGNRVGQIQKIFGKEGELVLKLWDNFPEDTDEPLWVEIDSRGVPLFLKKIRPQGSSKAVAVFEDWESEDLAGELVGKYLHSESCGDEGPDAQGLEGWILKDLSSGMEGTISGCNGAEMNPLLFVDFGGREILVPLAEEYVVSFDESLKTIEAELPEGLLELY